MSNQCICGEKKYKKEIRPGYITIKTGKADKCDIPIGICNSCKLIRQIDLPFQNEEEYEKYYREKYPPINKVYHALNYKGDLASGNNRFKKFDLIGTKRLLDLGCGSGALVTICRERNIEAYGCELVKYHYAPENPYIYYRKFEDILFPTDYFDKIICCDVIEHVLNPIKFLAELFRITEQEGLCYLEFPLFFDPNGGQGHWKRIEHIWYFTPKQFKEILKKVGFIIEPITINTGKTKNLIVAKKPKQNRKKVLLPPGIGDVYWPLVKIQSFLENEKIKPPVDAYIAAPRSKKHDSHLRAFPFLKMFPFLHSMDECKFDKNRGIWREGYLQQKRTIFKNVLGCDYFITWNGYQRAGKSLEEIDSHIKCNWFLPRFISLNEEKYRRESIDKYGKYLILYWVFTGSNSLLLRKFPINQLASMINTIVAETKLIPIMVGASWDLEDKELEVLKNLLPSTLIDLRGQTTLEEAFGLVRGAQATIGIPSGITIMSAVFKIKTILLFSEFFTSNGVNRKFIWNVFPPEVRKKTYFGMLASEITSEDFVSKTVSIINDTELKSIKLKDISKNEGTHKISENLNEPCISIRDITGEKQKVAIICVLKKGGDFTQLDVDRLHHMVKKNVTLPFKFICLTDEHVSNSTYDVIELKYKHKGLGWWSKIELFRPDLCKAKRIIYLDLDTIILKSLDFIMELDDNFIGLYPWNRKNRVEGQIASGMMSWINDGRYNFIYNTFPWDKVEQMNFGDQKYISDIMRKYHRKFTFFQNIVSGIYSYKRNCRNGLPQNAKIVCFHGRPRPANTNLEWVKKAYSGMK